MGQFLEARLPVDIRIGAQLREAYAVDITVTADGSEYRRLAHALPRLEMDISYVLESADLRARVLDFYHTVFGEFAGFRVRAHDYYSTAADDESAPSFSDADLIEVSTGVYQLTKRYGTPGTQLAIGLPVRRIYKPVAGTVVAGIRAANGSALSIADFTVDAATGHVTLGADKAKPITNITQAAQAVITVGSGHGYAVGDSVVVTDVAGMTEINGRRASVQATTSSTVTLAIDSTSFSAYASGGTSHTRPQADEAVVGGCEFDIPMRFSGPLGRTLVEGIVVEAQANLVELLNP